MLQLSDVNSGSNVRVVPLGLIAQVSYNDLGVISGVSVLDGHRKFNDRLSSSIVSALQKNNIIPSRVHIPNSMVEGVFFVDWTTIPLSVLFNSFMHDYMVSLLDSKDQNEVVFKAYNLEAKSITKYNAYQQDSNLKLMGFKICDNFSVSRDMKQNELINLTSMNPYPFISGYAVMENEHEGAVTSFVPSGIDFFKIDKVERYVNPTGYIFAQIYHSKSSKRFIASYTDVVKYNIQKGSVVAVDYSGSQQIAWCSDRNAKSNRVSNEIYCEVCGSLIHVPTSGYVRCSDDNCLSSMYPDVKRMMNSFNLPLLDYADYIAAVKDGTLHHIVDVFDMDTYKEAEVHCTLSKLLYAVCHVGVVRSTDFFDKLVECAGSEDAVVHYLDNPEQIRSDMSHVLNHADVDSYIKWISASANRLTVSAFMELENIEIQRNKITLNEVPGLLRNATIFLDGGFHLGSYSEVASILKSYGATITTSIDNRTTCVVYGELNSPESDSRNRQLARSYGIPIIEESRFFNRYSIYDDIEAAKN